MRFQKREIHTVFLRFWNLRLGKNLSLPALADLFRASLVLRLVLAAVLSAVLFLVLILVAVLISVLVLVIHTFLPPMSAESLNRPSSAEQRIFFPSCAVSKVGNTQSIPTLLKLSSGEKSLAVSSRRPNQSFRVLRFCR